MLRFLLMVASFANTAGGLVLIGTWALMWQRAPIIVVFFGASLLIQGAYTILYAHGELDRWGDFATGALFAGQALSFCVGTSGLIQTIVHSLNTDDIEIVPVLASVLMVAQALVALIYLYRSRHLRSRTRGTANS